MQVNEFMLLRRIHTKVQVRVESQKSNFNQPGHTKFDSTFGGYLISSLNTLKISKKDLYKVFTTPKIEDMPDCVSIVSTAGYIFF